MLGSNFVKFLMSISKRQVISSSNFASFFIVMTHSSSVNLELILFKDPIKVPILRLSSAQVKMYHIPYVIFQTTSHFFFFKFCFTFQCHERWLFCTFLGQTLNTLHNRNKWRCTFLRLSSFAKFLSFLKQQISFSSNFASIFRVMRHNSSVLF